MPTDQTITKPSDRPDQESHQSQDDFEYTSTEWDQSRMDVGESDGDQSYREENEILRRRLEVLESELERRKQRCQNVIDQYEQIIAEKNRQLDAREGVAKADSGAVSVIPSTFRALTGQESGSSMDLIDF